MKIVLFEILAENGNIKFLKSFNENKTSNIQYYRFLTTSLLFIIRILMQIFKLNKLITSDLEFSDD